MSKKIKTETRRNPNGTIDEVLIYVGKQCVFHLEQMSNKFWYMGLYADPDTSIKGKIEQFAIEGKNVTVRNYKDK